MIPCGGGVNGGGGGVGEVEGGGGVGEVEGGGGVSGGPIISRTPHKKKRILKKT